MPDWAATWIEHWPPAVQRLSLPQQGLVLARDEVEALGRRNGVAPAAFGPAATPAQDEAVLQALAARLDALLARLRAHEPAAQAFVRLGSRSPKDTPRAVLGGLQVGTGHEAVAALTAGSQRVGFDLRVAWQAKLAPWVWLRAWQPMAWPEEWRCFVRGGRLVGATQYLHAQPLPAGVDLADVEARLQAAVALLGPALGTTAALQNVVADWWLPSGQPAQLIELNPWGPPTEPGLFRWEDEDLDGSLRWRTASGPARRVRPARAGRSRSRRAVRARA